ncbi:M28 family metallopeptidase [Polluticaenibacter yanchengensis]|uniref:M20/M25/M40 family metallo-hydrolase n=1 Tax=Polluticaenibacter yanchengensis TaxID=3014562 RepID=A0ABT4UIT2_9BACT|nr:M20/M25/M40 family metallo-hydrolase [Chitinophagaceae bacterium LY-5]
MKYNKLTTAALFTLGFFSTIHAQNIDKIINIKEVSRIEKTLCADDMEGRQTFTTGIEKAADFIADEMKKAGLQPLKGASGYRQPFSMYAAKLEKVTGMIGTETIDKKEVVCLTPNSTIHLNDGSKNAIVTRITSKDNFIVKFREAIGKPDNQVILVDSSFSKYKQLVNRFKGSAQFKTQKEHIVVFTSQPEAKNYAVYAQQSLTEKKLANVVGIIPGKSKAGEYVIFSGHYDHIGYGKPNEKGDSLYNGANDDAAGITGILALAKYFKALNNNERTIIFAAFTAEEIGGFGSKYFSEQLNPKDVVAMFNLEMIGTDSKWGKNSAYITGYEKTNMGEILNKNLQGTAFKFYPDPYTEQQLFYRSDNATLARLGVPAHTISTSKMDIEPHYHKPSDEFATLDMENMTQVIKAIAISAKSIISGADTPTRVDISTLR